MGRVHTLPISYRRKVSQREDCNALQSKCSPPPFFWTSIKALHILLLIMNVHSGHNNVSFLSDRVSQTFLVFKVFVFCHMFQPVPQ